jgi:serine/threonine protein kinase
VGAGRDQVISRNEAEDEDSYYTVSELALQGEVFDYAAGASGAGGLKIDVARELFSQLCQGITYLHEKKMPHGDLKLENCLLDKDYKLKIADFGL